MNTYRTYFQKSKLTLSDLVELFECVKVWEDEGVETVIEVAHTYQTFQTNACDVWVSSWLERYAHNCRDILGACEGLVGDSHIAWNDSSVYRVRSKSPRSDVFETYNMSNNNSRELLARVIMGLPDDVASNCRLERDGGNGYECSSFAWLHYLEILPRNEEGLARWIELLSTQTSPCSGYRLRYLGAEEKPVPSVADMCRDLVPDHVLHTCGRCRRHNITRLKSFRGGVMCEDCYTKVELASRTCSECGDVCDTPLDVTHEDEPICAECVENADWIVCDECGKYVADGDIIEVKGSGGGDWCPTCVGDDAVRCDCCDEYVHNDNTFSIHMNGYGTVEEWCPDCVENDEEIRCCDECGDRYKPDDESDDMCSSCASRYVRCTSCNDRVRTCSVQYIDDDEYPYCQVCYESETEECPECGRRIREGSEQCPHCDAYMTDTRVHYHSWKPRWQMYGDPNELHMGVELEVDDGSVPLLLKELYNSCPVDESKFFLKHDGSLSDSGVEFVTHPCTLKYHEESFPWDKLTKCCKQAGYKSYSANDDNCGLHVHVTRKHFSRSEEVKIGLLVYTCVRQFEKIAQRNGNSYAKFKQWKASLGKLSQEERDCDRYSAINYTNKGTLEFRMFKGTLASGTIIAYLQTVHAACYFVKCNNTHQLLKHNCWDQFVQYVYERPIKYSVLIGYLERRGLSGALTGTNRKVVKAVTTANVDV